MSQQQQQQQPPPQSAQLMADWLGATSERRKLVTQIIVSMLGEATLAKLLTKLCGSCTRPRDDFVTWVQSPTATVGAFMQALQDAGVDKQALIDKINDSLEPKASWASFCAARAVLSCRCGFSLFARRCGRRGDGDGGGACCGCSVRLTSCSVVCVRACASLCGR